MSNFDPLPPEPTPDGSTWGEKDLIEYRLADGYHYFVQFGRITYCSRTQIEKRDRAIAWLKEHCIPYSWVGGRSAYEFCFQHEDEAVLFKLAYGI